MIYETNSPDETFEIGRKLGQSAKVGQIICLNGDLGVGKTVFTQGFASGLGIKECVIVQLLQLYKYMKKAGFRCIILMYIELVTLRKCMNWDMRIISLEKEYV